MSELIGLTGGIGTGKSTVSAMLEKLGSTVLSADAIVHELQARGTPLLAEMAEAFGAEILDASGALDRKALAAIVFADKEALERLNRIVHPKVGAEMQQRIEAARAAGAPLIVLDIPLLFEGRNTGRGGAAEWSYDATVLVYAPAAVQLERTVERDGCTRQEAQRRIDAQLPIDEKRALADHVIENDGDLEATERQVEALHRRLTAGA